ncbi:MAG: hypothetical protein C9356_14215 [Oleiphilus sp.]|nr:MAG: hypothetical protein C9356_14215 [Oleiphilus sp.]
MDREKNIFELKLFGSHKPFQTEGNRDAQMKNRRLEPGSKEQDLIRDALRGEWSPRSSQDAYSQRQAHGYGASLFPLDPGRPEPLITLYETQKNKTVNIDR